MTVARETIAVPGRDRTHSPVPEGIKVGNLIFSSLLSASSTEAMGDGGLDSDAELLFNRIRGLVEAGGGTVEDIVDLSAYVIDDEDRKAINKQWVIMFPDAADRPSRHILNVAPKGVHGRFSVNFMAILPDAPAPGEEVGNLVYSDLLVGRVPDTGEIPADPDRQAEALFGQLTSFVEGAGGTVDNIVNMMVYAMGDEQRAIVNKQWAKMYSDRSNLPARQTLNVMPSGLQEGLFAAVATALV